MTAYEDFEAARRDMLRLAHEAEEAAQRMANAARRMADAR